MREEEWFFEYKTTLFLNAGEVNDFDVEDKVVVELSKTYIEQPYPPYW
jgi:hypothetical protein